MGTEQSWNVGLLEWAVKNLRICFSREELERVSRLNIEDYKSVNNKSSVSFFENFIEDLYTYPHHEMFNKYNELLQVNEKTIEKG